MGKFSRAAGLGQALNAFNEGRFEESKRLLEQFKTQVGAAVDVGGLQVRQQAQRLDEQRFGQKQREFNVKTFPESQQGLQLGELQITEAERLRDENARLTQEAADTRAQLDALLQTEDTTRARRGAEQAKQTQETAIETSRVTGKFAEPEAKSIIKERIARAEALQRQKRQTKTKLQELREALITSGRLNMDQINDTVAEAALIDAEQLLSPVEVNKQIDGLLKVMANLQTAATVEEALAKAEESGDLANPFVEAIIISMGANAVRPLVTKEDRDAAIDLIRDRINQIRLRNRQRLVPITEPLLTGPPPEEGTEGVSGVAKPTTKEKLDKILRE